MVTLLELLGESLGREEACQILGPTLQCFFASFSSVHQTVSRTSTTTGTTSASAAEAGGKEETASPMRTSHAQPLTSSLKHTTSPLRARKSVEFQSLAAELDKKREEEEEEERSSTGTGPPVNTDSIPDSEYYRQLSTTFSKAMVHSSYITFCKLLGQYYLQDCLCNVDLIEQLAYSHDEEAQPYTLTSIFTDPVSLDPDTTSDSSGSENDDDYDDEEIEVTVARDAALKVGPVVAVTGLNMEEAGFRKSSWFVDLEDHENEEATPNKDVSVCI